FYVKEHQQPQEETFMFLCRGTHCPVNFFEWINDDEELKNGLTKPRGGRVRCFCGEPLTLRTSRMARNPNRRFISCPNRRCKFFEWVDGHYGTRSATRTRSSIGGDAGILGTKQHSGGFEDEIRKLESQQRKMEISSVDIEKLKVDLEQLDACVERMCDELNVVKNTLED
ncbi:hypothetical protein PIB30_071968, partial [Stylosanthes scabra]|nr:hypothetical protein [Stylosanthes scabra]